jgi:hypothetical protein
VGQCADCSDPDCDDVNCTEERSAHRKKDGAKTKKVDGVDLTSDCFAFVGDPEKTSTWKLPLKFPGDDEKTKSHIRNALARFEQTEGIPADEKDKVKAKIDAAAKAAGIDVSENSAVPDIEIRKRRLRLAGLEV